MNRSQSIPLVLAVLDLVRFAVIAAFALPLLGTFLTISENSVSNYRLLVWLFSPQIAIPLGLIGVSLGLGEERTALLFALWAKFFSATSLTFVLATLLLRSLSTYGLLFENESLLRFAAFTGISLVLDIIFSGILLGYRKQSATEV